MTKLRTHSWFTFAPARGRIEGSLQKLSLPATVCIVFFFCAATVLASPAQSVAFTSMYSFSRPGANPEMSLIHGVDGNFYGTTANGGEQLWHGI